MKSLSLVGVFVVGSVVAGMAAAQERVVTLSVPDMTCSACAVNVKRALSRVEGVKTIVLDPATLQAVVTFDDAKTNTDALLDVTGMAGYSATVKR